MSTRLTPVYAGPNLAKFTSEYHHTGTDAAYAYAYDAADLKMEPGRQYEISVDLRRNSAVSHGNGVEFEVRVSGVTYQIGFVHNWVTYGDVDEWETYTFITDPIPAGTLTKAVMKVNLYGAPGTGYDYSVRRARVVDIDTATYPLRLEVERDLEPGELLNLVPNPSGALGGWGWNTTIPNAMLTGGTPSGLVYTTGNPAPSGNYFSTEFLSVQPGDYVAASWHVNYTPYGNYRGHFSYFTAGRSYISSSPWVTFTAATEGTATAPATLIPATAAYAAWTFEVGGSGGSPYPYQYGGIYFMVRDVTVATAPNAAALADLSGVVPVPYVDVLGPTHEIKVNREALNLGTLDATILDAALDPAVADTIRPGRRVRLTAYNPESATLENLFAGKTATASVTYDVKERRADDPKHARITLSAVDATQPLAAAQRPQGVRTIPELPWVLEGAGVPWVCDGNSGQIPSATLASVNDNATAIDQIALTRDTALGSAWVDRNGVLQAWTQLPDPRVQKIPNPDFAANLNGWRTTWVGAAATFAHDASRCRMRANANGNTTQMRIDTSDASGTYGSKIPVKAGIAYTISADFYSSTNTRKAPVYVDWYSASNTYLSTSGDDYNAGTDWTTVGAWATLTKTVTAPAGATRAVVTVGISDTVVKMGANETHYVDNITMYALAPVVPIDESVYSGLDLSFDTDRCINSLDVNWLVWNSTSRQTDTYNFPGFQDATSVAEWGRQHKTFTVHGEPIDASTFAAEVLARNATPQVRPGQAIIPIKDNTFLPLAHLDLYDLVRVTNAAKAVDEMARVASISHTITPDKWLVSLDFETPDSVASPQVLPPIQTANPEGWQNLSLAVGWVNHGGGWQTAQYLRVGPEVQLRGLIRRTSGSGPIDQEFASLQVGYRPPAGQGFPCNYQQGGGGIPGKLNIYASGKMGTPAAMNVGHMIFLDGIRFRTD